MSYSRRLPLSRTWSAQIVRPFLRRITSAQEVDEAVRTAADRKMTEIRTGSNSSNRPKPQQVTKVMGPRGTVACLFLLAFSATLYAQSSPAPNTAAELYEQLRT